MSQASEESKTAAEAEAADHLTVGPGLVATKSQAKGATGGFLIGAVIGAIVGLIIGLVFQGPALWIAPIVFAVGGAVASAVFGGYYKSQETRAGSPTDA
jgi:predicted lipid-binding transport protein (Tim44 family)